MEFIRHVGREYFGVGEAGELIGGAVSTMLGELLVGHYDFELDVFDEEHEAGNKLEELVDRLARIDLGEQGLNVAHVVKVQILSSSVQARFLEVRYDAVCF